MRRRDREINIFNIAFLDVITGAMGAFILLVLLLAPYYTGPNPPPPHMKSLQKAINHAAGETKRLEHQINQAVKDGVDPRLLEKLKKLLHKLRIELSNAQKQMIRLRSEINHLESQNQKLKNENHALRRQLRDDRKLIDELKAEIAKLKAEIQKLKATIQKQRAQINYLKQHQGASAYRALDVVVEREHLPNGRFDAGVPFIVGCRTFWAKGIQITKDGRSVVPKNDPTFSFRPLEETMFIRTMIRYGAIPFPHQRDVRLWRVLVNNGPGVAKTSPNAMMLQVQEANLRSTVHIWVVLLLQPGVASRFNTQAKFLLTATYGKAVVHKTFSLSFKTPAIRFTFTPLKKGKMDFVHTPFGEASEARVGRYAHLLQEAVQ
ncbi:MAG: hypothetical protein ACP5O1_11660 [Phycisphaerae bacterium]